MNPQKRQRRAMVRREVGPDEKKPTRRRRKVVAGKPAEPQEPTEPRERTRRTLPPGSKGTPAWKAGGLEPLKGDD